MQKRDTTWLSCSVILAKVTLKHPSTDGFHEQRNLVPDDLYFWPSFKIRHEILCHLNIDGAKTISRLFRARIGLLVIREKIITPCLSTVCLPMVLSNGPTRTSIGTQPSLPSVSYSDPIKLCSTILILSMWWRTRMTMSERSLLATIRSVKSFLSSIPWLTLYSRYLRRLRVLDASGFSRLKQSISPMFQIFEKSSVWRDEGSSYLLRSMERMWLISLEIAN